MTRGVLFEYFTLEYVIYILISEWYLDRVAEAVVFIWVSVENELT